MNVRERAVPMICSGYEHFGVVVASSDEVEEIWNRLTRPVGPAIGASQHRRWRVSESLVPLHVAAGSGGSVSSGGRERCAVSRRSAEPVSGPARPVVFGASPTRRVRHQRVDDDRPPRIGGSRRSSMFDSADVSRNAGTRSLSAIDRVGDSVRVARPGRARRERFRPLRGRGVAVSASSRPAAARLRVMLGAGTLRGRR